MHRLVLVFVVAGLALSSSVGCLVRTRPGTGAAHLHGHPASHRHEHCHARGGKHHKQVCHGHPHGPGHH